MSTSTTFRIEQVILQPQAGLGVRETVPQDQLPDFFGRAFAELGAYIARYGGVIAGPPFARFYSVPPAAVDVEAIFPLARPLGGDGHIVALELPGGPAIQVLYTGPYADMAPVYDALTTWLMENHKRPAEPPREVYLSDPEEVPDQAQHQTLVIQPYS